jgi:multidrug efflux pump subunit AcrB
VPCHICPRVIGLGIAGGFGVDVQDRAGRDLTELAAATNALLGVARERPELTNMSSPFRMSVPQLSVWLDRDKTELLGIPITDVYDELQTFLDGAYVNDFNRLGRTWKVLMQADADFRRSPDEVDRFYVSTRDGLMVPLTALISIKTASGPEVVYRYNRCRAARIFGAVAPGYSAGQGSAVMEELAAKALPAGFGYEWTGTVYQQRKAKGHEAILFGLSAILVLLLLAALGKSWAMPFAVVLSVPLGIFGALVRVWIRTYAYDVYMQIGIVTLIGLAARNAILIVEFAKLRRDEGLSIVGAAVEAAHIRLRPILMT